MEVIFCGTFFTNKVDDRPLTGVLPFAVRTFLGIKYTTIARLIGYKGNFYFVMSCVNLFVASLRRTLVQFQLY
jgi:hypothetical protein